VEVWVDALGELASVGDTETWWDTAAVVPTLISVDDTPLLGLPGGVTAVGDAWSTPGWRAARATDASDPWAVLGQVAGLALPQGVGLTAGGGLTVAGLEWMGARVYDPAARGFLSTDPLAPVTGAAWSGNPYSYAGNDPLHTLDPLGLRPATDADLDAYAHANQGAFAAVGEWWGDNWEYVVAGAAIVAGVALMFTGVGGPAGIALMAASGALLSGGISVASQKATTGEVDWRQAGIDTAIGGATGALGAGAGAVLPKLAPLVSRAGSAITSGASRAGTALTRLGGRAGSYAVRAGKSALDLSVRAATSQAGMRTITNGAVGGIGNTGTYTVTTLAHGESPTLRGAGAAFTGGFVSGAISSHAGAVAEPLESAGLKFLTQAAVGGGGSAAGGGVDRALTGQEQSWNDFVIDAVGGAGLAFFPGADGLAQAPTMGDHLFAATGGQHASWIVDSTEFVLEETGIIG